jgi:hypothetical protein
MNRYFSDANCVATMASGAFSQFFSAADYQSAVATESEKERERKTELEERVNAVGIHYAR